MIGSDTQNVVHMPNTQVCIKDPQKSGRTTEQLVMGTHP
jgi:hypothetical protein